MEEEGEGGGGGVTMSGVPESPLIFTPKKATLEKHFGNFK